MKQTLLLNISLLLALSLFGQANMRTSANSESLIESTVNEKSSYEDLLTLFKVWRSFESPPMMNGAPDYTQDTFTKRWPLFKDLRRKLIEIDTANWTIPQRVDWMLVWAEMNGYD
ncbi:MAG: hypothetical protein HKO11_05190, partial [Eudoraea sp.]|nr:hypothetical protein [Eudoraea sp.]